MDAKANRKVLRFPSGVASSTPTGERRSGVVERLYREHWAELCRRLRRLYGDGPPEPEDLAQAAFLKVTEMPNLEDVENPRAYLFRAAVNIGLNAIDRVRRTRRLIDEALAEAGESLEEISPSRVYEGREVWRVVERAFETLSDKQREIILRCRVKGETYAEISAATGWSQADISRQLNAAVAKLQQARANGEKDEA